MIDFSASIPANFVANATAAFEYGKGTYAAISPTYTGYLLFKYGDDVLDSANLTSMGNLALTVLAMPGIKESLVKTIYAPLGIDEEVLNTYVSSVLTCLNVAATVIPMVSSYLGSKGSEQQLESIKEAVQKVETGLPKKQSKAFENKDVKKQDKDEPRGRRSILNKFSEENASKQDKPSQNPHRRGRRKHKP